MRPAMSATAIPAMMTARARSTAAVSSIRDIRQIVGRKGHSMQREPFLELARRVAHEVISYARQYPDEVLAAIWRAVRPAGK